MRGLRWGLLLAVGVTLFWWSGGLLLHWAAEATLFVLGASVYPFLVNRHQLMTLLEQAAERPSVLGAVALDDNAKHVYV